MTTIATNGLIVAADTLGCVGAEKMQFPVSKIHREGKRVYGFSGSLGLMMPVIRWYECGGELSDVPKVDHGDWQMIVCEPGKIEYLCNECPAPVIVAWPFAIGTGGDYAIGAMDAGADPIQAVKIAIGRDKNSGGGVMHLAIEETLKVAAE